MSITGFIGFTNYMTVVIPRKQNLRLCMYLFCDMNLFQILSNFLAIKDTRKRSSQARPTAAAFLPRTNEDTSKLEPPNVIAFKRQQAHLAHKEASLT